MVCPAGTYNDNLFGKSIADCRPCPNGHECAEMTVDKGDVCQQGYYCPIGSYPQQYPCPAGSHGASRTGKSDVSECLPCPPGNYCPEGSASPTLTPAGRWTPLSNVPSLEATYKCPPKFHCPNDADNIAVLQCFPLSSPARLFVHLWDQDPLQVLPPCVQDPVYSEPAFRTGLILKTVSGRESSETITPKKV